MALVFLDCPGLVAVRAMKAAEWEISADPMLMLYCLERKGTDRQWRLFCCGCCRHIWERLPDQGSRKAVEAAEAFADGRLSKFELLRSRDAAFRAFTDRMDSKELNAAIEAAESYDARDGFYWARVTSHEIVSSLGDGEAASQSAILRDIFGNPFRPVTLDPAWLTATVVSLAQAVYDERAFDRMPILGDALEDAGCTQEEILNHCRQPGEHVRGCWCVDVIIGKA